MFMRNKLDNYNKVLGLVDRDELPLVSVVIPVYNVEQYIQEALDSVLAQSYQNLEILIIDDGSPDKSISIIKQNYRDPRIRIIRQDNRGLAGARNTGIRNAKGCYVAFLDSDDFWQANKIELHLEVMRKNPNCGVSFCSSSFVNENSQFIGRLQAPSKKCDYQAKDIFCRNPIGNGSVPVIRKSVLEQIAFNGDEKIEYVQYFDEGLRQSEDVDCWTRIAILTGTDFHYIDRPLIEGYAPGFAQKYGPSAKAFQYRYLARRSVFQGQAKHALQFMWLAFRTKPLPLIRDFKRTVETTIASLALSFLSTKVQKKLLERFV